MNYPRPEEPDVPEEIPPRPLAARNPLGWIALALIFTFLILNSSGRSAAAGPKARRASYDAKLKAAIALRKAGDNAVAMSLSGNSTPDDGFRDLEKEVAPRRRQEAVESAVWAAVRTELKEPVAKEDLAPLTKEPSYAPFLEIYSPDRITPKRATALAARLDRGDTLAKLAATHARAEAGMPKLPDEAQDLTKALVIGLLFFGLIFASGIAWLSFVVFGLSGQLRSLGPASKIETGAEADVFAIRASALMIAFFGLSLTVSLLRIDSRLAELLAYGPMLLVVPLVLSKRPSMADVGLSTKNLGRDVLLGLWAFLLEIPVTAGLAWACTILLKNLPKPEHPATTALQNTHDVGLILVTLFMGAIVAPFWEETMFRGLLFPALRKVLRGAIPAALVSSFLFASIHPQGPVLWAALGSVALASCALAQHTRSLVPSIVMHFAHNATLLTIAVLYAT